MRIFIDLQETIDELKLYITEPNISDDETKIKGFNNGLETAISVVSGMPAAPVIPIMQHNREKGKWIPHDEEKELWMGERAKGGVECSVCGYKTYNKTHKLFGCPFHYCPMCGTEMQNNV